MTPRLDADVNLPLLMRIRREVSEELDALLLRRAREAQSWSWKPTEIPRDEVIAAALGGVILRCVVRVLRAVGVSRERFVAMAEKAWDAQEP